MTLDSLDVFHLDGGEVFVTLLSCIILVFRVEIAHVAAIDKKKRMGIRRLSALDLL